MDRRKFIKTTATGLALIGAGMLNISCSPAGEDPQNNGNENGNGNGNESEGGETSDTVHDAMVQLGATGLTVPLMAMGTGTSGWGG